MAGTRKYVSRRQRIKAVLRIDRALRLVWRSAPRWTVASLVLLMVQAVLPLATLYLLKLVIDAVASGLAGTGETVDFGRIAVLIGLTAATALIGFFCQSINGIVNEFQVQTVSDHVHDILHAKSIEVDLAFYEDPANHDSLHRAQREAMFRPTRIVGSLLSIGQNGLTLLAMLGLLVTFHWAIAVVLFVSVIPGLVIHLFFARKWFQWERRRTSTERQALNFNRMLTGLDFAKEIRLFELGGIFRQRFSALRSRLRREKLKIATWSSIANLAAQTGATLAVYGSFAFVAYRAFQGVITMGDLVMYYQAFQKGQTYFKSLMTGLGQLYENNLFITNLYEFLDLKPKITDPSSPEPLPALDQAGIVFDRVSFGYATSQKNVLDNVSLTIKPGEHIALVGMNGAGKTTLIKLLCRLYDPTSGSISLNGVDVRRFDLLELRRNIGVLFQDYVKYNLSAEENIRFGNSSIPPGDGRIFAAARLSGADRVIDRLPKGYDTNLGKMFEGGEEISIGEWQKIALARTFLRESPLIILDEPTSSLDAKTEYDIFQHFHRLTQGRTAVLISHRLSTVRMVDRIFVLENETITESGSHDELMKLNGVYARLFRMQAQNYR